MKRILITGSNGFVGRNLDLTLGRMDDVLIERAVSGDSNESLMQKVMDADIIFHLAGSNRPLAQTDFERINVDLTRHIIVAMQAEPLKQQKIVFASSIQASQDNHYGLSKRRAEELLTDLNSSKSKKARIYRLPNIFGKWSRPNYNSVVATFCYNLSHNLPITISEPDKVLELVYIDDLVAEWLRQLTGQSSDELYGSVDPVFTCTLSELAERIRALSHMREYFNVPDLSDRLNFSLHATYTSYLDEDKLARSVDLKVDSRGWLFELAKSASFGQVFVSKTKPGVTRGNHYHDSKIERFCLVQGRGLIRFRKVGSDEIIEYFVDDLQIKTVDILPGYTHSIENIGDSEMIVLFWANEIFNPAVPDTFYQEVLN